MADFNSPEELPPGYMDQLIKGEMAHSAMIHMIDSMIESLDKDGLIALRYMMVATMRSDGYAPYADGILTSLLKYKFKVCVCGINHEEELLSGSSNPPEEGNWTTEEEYKRDCETYNVRPYDLSDIENGLDVGVNENPVLCLSCKFLFQSLDDRKFKPPSKAGCPGCVHNEKWG